MPEQDPSLPLTDRQKSGRSAPRSRNGCVVCKQRRVRCDEIKPTCGHCRRLDLQCGYRKRAARGQESDVAIHSRGLNGFWSPGSAHDSRRGPVELRGRSRDHLPIPPPAIGHTREHVYVFPRGSNSQTPGLLDTSNSGYDFLFNRSFDPPDGQDFLETFTFSEIQPNTTSWRQDFLTPQSHEVPSTNTASGHGPRGDAWNGSIEDQLDASPQARRDSSDVVDFTCGSDYMKGARSEYLLSYFSKITQPPASILITGVRKWRRLQHYIIKMSHQHRVVASSLFATMEILAKDDATIERLDGFQNLASMEPALRLHEETKKELERLISTEWQASVNMRDALLASIFLLAWFEVLRDQPEVFDQKLFPGDLADQVITSSGSWSRYSKRLLQWLNTLDSKASHLGGNHLLSQKALEVVSEHHTQINADDGDEAMHSEDDQDHALTPKECYASPDATATSVSRQTEPDLAATLTNSINPRSLGQMKTLILNTILQPALDWYQSTQKYCRHISSHDRHHRSRFTVKDEYEVVIVCKQLELQLMHLWKQRPQVITLSASQLQEIVCVDIAARLEAIFSLYMASYWVLFVYLHRVVWWHLPHSEITEHALEETWKNLQRSFGEVVEGQKKVLHPALLWPLFMFGSECRDELRKKWAVEQLLALGNPGSGAEYDDSGESLAPFKLNPGATRNAKRAALLLEELNRRQTLSGSRVDDKELSLELFGCHFSII